MDNNSAVNEFCSQLIQKDIEIIKTNRKSIAMSLTDNYKIVVRCPLLMPDKAVKDFVTAHWEWIEKSAIRIYAQNSAFEKYPFSYLKEQALAYIPARLDYFSKVMGLTPTGMKITNARKRFGSCNTRNSICFSAYLMFYPKEAIDYVIVHELAHIKEKNHSKRFYQVIEKIMPDYKDREKLLKKPINEAEI